MADATDLPVAVRAVAFMGMTRHGQALQRRVRYDVYWADGRMAFDVDLSKMMHRGSAADFYVVEREAHSHCPELGAGQWIGASGSVVEGPSQPEPTPPENLKGRPQLFGAEKIRNEEQFHKTSLVWRLVIGTLALAFGLYVVFGAGRTGVFGFLGLLCCFAGFLLLLSSLPETYRFWMPNRERRK